MKKILSFMMVAVLALMLAGCSKYDDTELRNKVNGYESRIAALESLSTYQTLLQKLQAGKTVTAYSQSGNDITLTFSDGSSVTFNQQGVPGESIAGPAGPTPTFQIKDDRWQVSYDDGKTWSDVGPAVEHSLFKNVAADGSTLTITLADGTVIPVAYGEKEGYTFTLGDGQRKCYSFWESKESFRTGILKIPYTLTGELTSVDDVKIIASVDNFATEFVQTKETVTVEPIDAKSGNIVLKRLHQIPRADSDDAFEALFPGFYLDLVAYFPDGSAKTAGTIKVLTEKLRLTEGFEVMDYSNLWEIPEMPFVIDADETEFELYYSAQLGDYDYQEYDGDPIYEPVFGKDEDMNITIYSNSGSGGNFINTNYSVEASTRYWGAASGTRTVNREIYLKFQVSPNTTGVERRQDISFMKHNGQWQQRYFVVRVIQRP